VSGRLGPCGACLAWSRRLRGGGRWGPGVGRGLLWFAASHPPGTSFGSGGEGAEEVFRGTLAGAVTGCLLGWILPRPSRATRGRWVVLLLGCALASVVLTVGVSSFGDGTNAGAPGSVANGARILGIPAAVGMAAALWRLARRWDRDARHPPPSRGRSARRARSACSLGGGRGMVRRALAGLALAASLAPSGARAALPPLGCAWPLKADADTLNVAFPDESATYWVTHVVAVPGARLEIRGAYPAARYFSFHAYDEAQRPVGALADVEIAPDPGSDNPFSTPGARPGGTYTAFVEFTRRPADPRPNTLYTGTTSEGAPNPAGFFIYRVYVADHPDDPAGGMPLPRLALLLPGGLRIPFAACRPLPPSLGGALNGAIQRMSFPDAIPRQIPFPPAATTPAFRRFYGLDRIVWDRVPSNPFTDQVPRFQGGFLSNMHVAYLYRTISRQLGDVFVMQARAPTFPDTRPPGTGEPTDATQVRYWSVCQNELVTQRFVACRADYQTALDDDGRFTFVVSDPADRPSDAALARHHATWLPWGGAFYDGIVIYRHMLPSRSFPQAIQNVPEGTDPASVMGEYFPRSGSCTRRAFETGGPAACIES
jgi:hypothetical protein